ncbi:MAG TPA: Flp family type IVb pilin [Devosiaceae bacterium]|jgi:pilus assembly protein Flp/PilA|nr:Flp family type IVb pilin [Devosiaceae bacterium]
MGHEVLRFGRDQCGATAIEYGLIAALIAVAAIVAMTLTGDGVADLFGGVEERATAVFDEADV